MITIIIIVYVTPSGEVQVWWASPRYSVPRQPWTGASSDRMVPGSGSEQEPQPCTLTGSSPSSGPTASADPFQNKAEQNKTPGGCQMENTGVLEGWQLPCPILPRGQTWPSQPGPLGMPPCVSVCPVKALPRGWALGSLCVPSHREHGIP